MFQSIIIYIQLRNSLSIAFTMLRPTIARCFHGFLSCHPIMFGLMVFFLELLLFFFKLLLLFFNKHYVCLTYNFKRKLQEKKPLSKLWVKIKLIWTLKNTQNGTFYLIIVSLLIPNGKKGCQFSKLRAFSFRIIKKFSI